MTDANLDIWQEKVYCPVTPELHPKAREIEEAVLDWLNEFELGPLDLARRGGWGLLASWIYPRGNVERVIVAARLLAWICQYDEAGFERPASGGAPDRTGRNLLRSLKIMEEPDLPIPDPDPYHLAWQDAHRQLRRIATPGQVHRFNHGLTRMFVTVGCEALFEMARRMPTLHDARMLRRGTGAASPGGYGVLVEVVGGYELPYATWADPRIQLLGHYVSDLAGGANDIIGARRDTELKAVPMNVVVALAQERGLSLADAARAARELHKQSWDTLIDLAGSLRTDAGPQLDRYLTEMLVFTAGNHGWYNEFSRHHRYGGTEEFADVPAASPPATRSPDAAAD
ncbi:terpene synthase family protein [Streptomyces qinzhouensis]|nr:hypothetical protein [Streptomyces qinzhouensis]